jgi:hypothetical protein
VDLGVASRPEGGPTVASKPYANDQDLRVIIAELEYQGVKRRGAVPPVASFPGGVGCGWPAHEPDPDRRALIDHWLEDRDRRHAA